MDEVKSISGYVIGIVSLVLAFFNPLPGLILGIIGVIQCSKQKNKVSQRGKVLSIIAIIVSIIFIIIALLISFNVIKIPNLPV